MIALVVGCVAMGLAAWAAVDLRAAYTSLRVAESQVAEAQAASLDGEMTLAAERFEAASESFAEADEALRRPAVRALGRVPVVDRNLEVVRGLAEAGGFVADAGAAGADAVQDLPGGSAAFAPQAGRLPVDRIAEFAPTLREVADGIDAASARMAATPATWLAGPVAAARVEFTSRLEAVVEPARAAAVLAETLPGYLGAEEQRTYIFGAQNPAELRGTGGLIGAWTLLTVRDGELEFGDFETIGTLTLTGDEAYDMPPPNEDYGARYGRFAAAGHGSNINMTPDFPTAAEALLNLYERQRGETLDGVIVADPYVFEALLRVTGPVEVPDVRRVDADTVVDFVTNQQYAEFDENDPTRKLVLGEVAQAALERFLIDGGAEPARSLQVLGEATGDGHLLLHSAHESEQDAFVETGLAGAFPADHDGAVFGVITNNAAANKLDYYLEQTLDYEIWLAEDGSAYGRASIGFTNTAPTSGAHPTVLGPYGDNLVAGEHQLYVSTYCSPECSLLGFSRDGEPSTVGVERELGATVFPTTVRLPSGSSEELAMEWRQDGVWDGTEFHLIVPEQPLMRPPSRRVTVHPPPGVTLHSASDWAGVGSDGSLVWESEGREPVSLDLTARRAGGWWERLVRERR